MKTFLKLVFPVIVTLTAAGADPKVGDLVRISSQNPLVVLGKAQVTDITLSNITVAARFESYTFNKTNVVIIPLLPDDGGAAPTPPRATPSAAAALMPGTASFSGSSPGGGDPGLAILDKFSSDPGYTNAVKSYQGDMSKVMGGQMEVNQLRIKAEAILKQADEYQPERQKDPQYEAYIASLRDFVRRAKAGESFNFPVGPAVNNAPIP